MVFVGLFDYTMVDNWVVGLGVEAFLTVGVFLCPYY